MVTDATQKSFEEICNGYDGRFKGIRSLCQDENIFIYPGELERIFPDELKQIKKRAELVIGTHIKLLNDMLPDSDKIDEKIKNALIDCIIANGHELLLSHLYEIEYLWFNRRLHWTSSILAHIRSLAVSIESIGRNWYGQNRLGNIIEFAFKKEYTKLKDSIGMKLEVKRPEEYKQELLKVLEHGGKTAQRNYSHHLLIAHLTRNYL